MDGCGRRLWQSTASVTAVYSCASTVIAAGGGGWIRCFDGVCETLLFGTLRPTV
jgi:hypothetical protein